MIQTIANPLKSTAVGCPVSSSSTLNASLCAIGWRFLPWSGCTRGLWGHPSVGTIAFTAVQHVHDHVVADKGKENTWMMATPAPDLWLSTRPEPRLVLK